MKLLLQLPQKAVKAFVKQPVLRSEMDVFKANLIALLDKINTINQRPKDESEEHLKNDLRDFLRDTYYRSSHAINTKDKKDLVVHLGKTTDSDVGVIIEAKRPTNLAEMITAENANKKALHELILYYFDERGRAENAQLKHLIITNINEWYVFDANEFDKHIYRNSAIKKCYETKINDRKDNPFFYEEMAKIVAKTDVEIPCVYFNLKTYDRALRNQNPDDDRELTALYKLLSPQHLLKVAVPNDANSLNERFYKELLHIIGLEETKDGGKNVIRRKETNQRHAASLLEAAIDAIETEDVLHRIPDGAAYGNTLPERTFNVALELCITWINRILFLKLLEGQLTSHHQNSNSPSQQGKGQGVGVKEGADYLFLNSQTINDFDELFKLFHKVLAVNLPDRTEAIKAKYSRVPYLNSSLFDISELEDQTIKINALDNNGQLEVLGATVLKELKTKKLPTLAYLFQFLDAYDFASDGTAVAIQDDHRTIINASVLGKVFEKINGYKDGSIFTPAFITMYMCRQTIRQAVVEKFNQSIIERGFMGVPTFRNLNDVYDQIGERFSKIGANDIVNSLKICDPAVGSGHFLVSALNEIIAIKNDLKILGSGVYNEEDCKNVIHNRHKARLRDYEVEIVNDELQITDEYGRPFVYNPRSRESQRVQEILFHEKQIIIENCLFGVDINPNSVKICRLRLWIELLKSAYYQDQAPAPQPPEGGLLITPPLGVGGLQTLPNIDINIKCGNSLLSRFALDADLSKALRSIKYDVAAYRGFVNDYKNEKNRDTKRGLTQIINSIKADFVTEISNNDKRKVALNKASGLLYNLTAQTSLVAFTPKQAKARKEDQSRLETEISKLTREIEDIKNNVVYKNAFEWRFEFPEVLNDDGDFVGFDVVIGNPPYMRVQDIEKTQPQQKLLYEQIYRSAKGAFDLANLFFELAINIAKTSASNAYIFPHKFLNTDSGTAFRDYLTEGKYIDKLAHFGANMIFDNADTYTCIALFSKTQNDGIRFQRFPFKANYKELIFEETNFQFLSYESIKNAATIYGANNWILFDNEVGFRTFEKIYQQKASIKTKFEDIFQGIATSKDDLYVLEVLAETENAYQVVVPIDNQTIEVEKQFFKPFLMGKEVQRFGMLQPKRVVFFPYQLDNNLEIVSENELQVHFPLTHRYLMRYEKEFKKRENGKAAKMKCWYAYIYPKNLNKFEQPKLSSMEICANHPNVTLNLDNFYHSTTVYSWVKKEETPEDYKYFLAIINSSLMWWFLKNTGDTLQGDARRFKTNYLNPFPLPAAISAAEQQPFIDLVDKILLAKQSNNSTTDLEAQIDNLVFELYGLTAAEVAVVAGEQQSTTI